jgi:methionine transaminase
LPSANETFLRYRLISLLAVPTIPTTEQLTEEKTAGVPSLVRIQSRLPQIGISIFTQMTELANQHQAINLAQGFPNFSCDPRLVELTSRAMQRGLNQYAPMAGYMPLREAIAADVARRYDVHYDPATEVTITAGASEALFAAITAVIQPGDEVIVFEPCYDSYLPAIELSGGVPRFVQLSFPDYRIDWSQVRKLINPRTKAILLNTPHNPTGTTLQAEDLQMLEHIARDSDIVIISDEVYEHMVYDGEQHHSPRSVPELAGRTFVVGSFGKSLHVTGWKVGYCLAPAELSAELRKVRQFITFTVPTPLQVGIAEYIMEHPDFGDGLSKFYQGKRDLFASLMAESRFRPLPSKGTYFQLFAYDGMSEAPEADFARELTEVHKVAAIPVSAFYHQPNDNFVLRFCFAKDDATLSAAAERLRLV